MLHRYIACVCCDPINVAWSHISNSVIESKQSQYSIYLFRRPHFVEKNTMFLAKKNLIILSRSAYQQIKLNIDPDPDDVAIGGPPGLPVTVDEFHCL